VNPVADFFPSVWTNICSAHFEKDCFLEQNTKRHLKPGCVPTLFLKPDDQSLPAIVSVRLDHNYYLPTQAELKRRLNIASDELVASKKHIKRLKESRRRQKQKCQSVRDVLRELQKKKLLSETNLEKLLESGSKVPAQLFQRLVDSKHKDVVSRKHYTPDLKRFAVTLQYYSNKAYNYVRETFLYNLPHENVIRRWYASIQCETGMNGTRNSIFYFSFGACTIKRFTAVTVAVL
jgi:Transposase protein